MQQSLLIEALQKLQRKEMTRFVSYVQSPYFNKNEKAIKLISYLEKIYPKLEGKKIERDVVRQKTLGKGSDDKSFNQIVSLVLRLLEGFLAQEIYHQQAHFHYQYLLQQLRQKHLDKHFLRVHKKWQQQLEKNNITDRHTFFKQYLLAEEADLYYDEKGMRRKDEQLQAKVNQLDYFYLSNKLRACCEMVNREQVIHVNYKKNLLTELLDIIQQNWEAYSHYPAITIYFQILQMMLHEDKESHFQQLIKDLHQNSEHFSKQEAKEMYDYAQNYCVHQINKGKRKYLNELYYLNQELLTKKLIFKNGYLNQWDYKNIVTVGLRLQKYEWIEQFIQDYKPHLRPEFADNAYHYNLACLYFGQQKYDDALRTLHLIELTDVGYYIGTKTLLIKIYYETQQTEALFSLISTLRVYVSRSDLYTEAQKKSTRNLMRFTEQAFKIRLNKAYISKADHQKAIHKLKDQIQKDPMIANINWLSKKVAAL